MCYSRNIRPSPVEPSENWRLAHGGLEEAIVLHKKSRNRLSSQAHQHQVPTQTSTMQPLIHWYKYHSLLGYTPPTHLSIHTPIYPSTNPSMHQSRDEDSKTQWLGDHSAQEASSHSPTLMSYWRNWIDWQWPVLPICMLVLVCVLQSFPVTYSWLYFMSCRLLLCLWLVTIL